MTKVQIPAEPIQLSQQTHKIDSYRQQAETALELVQHVVTAYNAVGLGELTQQELKRMIQEGPQQLVREKVAGTEPVKVGGLMFAPEKVQALLELPDLGKLSSALSEVQQLQRRDANTSYGPKVLDAVIIVEGAAVANAEKLRQVELMYTTYAETEAEKDAYLHLKEAAAILDYLTDKYGAAFVGTVLTQQPNFRGGGYTANINTDYLKGALHQNGR